MRTFAAILLGGLLLFLPNAPAQSQPADRSFYKVEFTITDGAGSPDATTRHFVILTDTEGRGSLQTGTRIPYVTYRQDKDSDSPPQYQYADVSVSIDCHLRDVNGKIALNGNVNMSLLDLPQPDQNPSPPAPVIGNVRTGFTAILKHGTPTTVASVDDPVTERKLDIEATLTKLE